MDLSDSSRERIFLTRVPSDGSHEQSRQPRFGLLPDELVEQSTRRVEVAAWVGAVVWGLAIVTNIPLGGAFRTTGFPGAGGWPIPNVFFAAAGLLSGAAVGIVARRYKHRPRVVTDLGLSLEVFTCLVVSVISFWAPAPHAARISWSGAVILLYPAIAPAPERKVLIASLAAATMDVVGFGIARARGLASDWPVLYVIWMLFPTYLCAVLALVPARVIQRLSRAAQSARVLGSYRLIRRLGEGAMGVVYEASHRLIARPAAIKLIKPELLGDWSRREELTARFHREADTVAKLRSPHTVQLYDFGQAPDGTLYCAMELLEGMDLERLVMAHGPLPPGRVINILRQACASLAEAHSHGLVHRDIKPSNLFICRTGLTLDFVKVLDFGLVRPEPGSTALQHGGDLTATKGLGPPGTPAFISPEAVMGHVVGCRADLYSLACVGYWLLTGKPVFDGDNPVAVMYRHAYQEPAPPSTVAPHAVPPELDRLLMAALAKDPEERIASAEEFARRLEEIRPDSQWSDASARIWWDQHYPVPALHST